MSLVGSGGRIGEARARADLSSGSLGVFAMAQGPNEFLDFNGAEANANLTETVFLHVSPTITGNFTASLRISATGSISGEDVNFRAQSGSIVQIQVHHRDFLGRNRLVAAFERALSDAPFIDTVAIPIVRGNFADPANPFFTVSTSLIIGQSGPVLNATADFFGTATLALTLPEGVTFTSESGIFLTAAPSGGHAPTANAGPDQTVAEGTGVTLDGTSSFDPDGSALSYQWTQVAGVTVTLSNATAAMPGFTAPAVNPGGAALTFQLVVNDGSADSAPAMVNVTVQNVNHAPSADAGSDQVVSEGSPVTLDGSASFDPDGENLTYIWTRTGGPQVALTGDTTAHPSFTAPAVGPTGALLTFALTVSDGLATATDTVNVWVENVNHPPSANAGADQARDEGALVSLDGTASSDPDGDRLAYAWTQSSGPAVTLSDAASATPTFVAPPVTARGAILVFRLLVSDALGGSASDEVSVLVQNVNDPPACQRAQATPSLLWPPNHKLVPVAITGVTDPNGGRVTTRITAVTQDEPVKGLGDGDTSPDAVLQGSSVLLRAERSGAGNGRLYRLQFMASDEDGGTCTGSVDVQVPKSLKQAVPVMDSGQLYDSTRQ